MKHLRFVILIGTLLLIVSACSSEKQDLKANNTKLEVLEASIMLPEQLIGDKSDLYVQLTQGSQPLADAEVLIKIWKKDEDNKKTEMETIHTGDGLYSVQMSVPEDGIYIVQAKVSANDMDIMPKKQWIVGAISEEEHHELQLERDGSKQELDHGHHH